VGSRAQQEDMIRAIEANPFKPVISDRLPLDAIATAFDRQAKQQHFGKIVLTI
jgi:NADPH:quinone reductase-like Zn-dependent oxidoreductase